MAKREFIDKRKAENITWQEPYYHDPINVCSEIRYKIRELPTFTEQDIVKPYLELLLKEMQSLEEINNSDDGYDKGYQHGRASCGAMVMHMIDNLLQGDPDGKM